LRTFYRSLTKATKRIAAWPRLNYLREIMRAAAAAKPVSMRSESETVSIRVKKCFSAAESLDADATASFFAVGATLMLPGLAPITGRSAIRSVLIQLSLDADELRHALVQLWTAGSVCIYEADATLTLSDGTVIAFPVTYIIRWANGLIQEARVNVYLESRMAVAMSAFDRLRMAPCALSRPA
jgi:hypothetical protein